MMSIIDSFSTLLKGCSEVIDLVLQIGKHLLVLYQWKCLKLVVKYESE